METIEIPFNEWSRDRLRAGIKSVTSRFIKYGEAGDVFTVDGKAYGILYVTRVTLAKVTYLYYRDEGCDSPEEFIEVWNDIHPNKEFDFNQLVWFHKFFNKEKTPTPKLQPPELEGGQKTLGAVG